jgi:beta-glucanase (GH16 family)
MRIAIVTLLSMLGAVPAAPKPTAELLDLRGYRMTFAEDFASPPTFYHLRLAPAGRWKTNYAFGGQDPDAPGAAESRTLAGNGELQYYGDPLAGTGSFEWRPGRLAIVARQNPIDDRARFGGKPYRSGLLTSQRSFEQRYGYFEARLTLPAGQGLWSAFWLLPRFREGLDLQPGQEIDVVENIGRDGEYYATVHRHDASKPGNKAPDGARVPIPSVVTPHDYGVLVTPDSVAWYLDRRLVRRVPNTDFHAAAYLLFNLAVGGNWPGRPDETTRFPAQMIVERIRVYQALPGRASDTGLNGVDRRQAR